MNIDVFQVLKSQAIEVVGFLCSTRDFALAKGLHNDAEWLNDCLQESQKIISIADKQISELEQTKGIFQLGLFDTINSL